MKIKKIYYFIFQTLFFTLTFFLLHYWLFDFNSSKNPQNFFNDWSGVLLFDLVGGILIGLVISCFSILLSKVEKSLIISIILTDIVWLIFCVWWYFNNRGAINTEAVGHLISPFIVGAFGGFLAVLNLIYFLLQSEVFRKRKSIDE